MVDIQRASLDRVAEAITLERKATLLLGAGCSASGHIPLASEITQDLLARFPAIKAKIGPEATYAGCMLAISQGERHDYVKRLCEDPKVRINWTHLAIAQLLLSGHVDRVLTTNFDPLIVKACALIGFYPPVYDLAAATAFNGPMIDDRAIFHLHGQYAGFVQVHTGADFSKVKARLGAAVDACFEQRTWVVCGYSGLNDPLVRVLGSRRSPFGLYWIAYKDQQPTGDVVARVLAKDNCYYLPGYDADRFFVELARAKKSFRRSLSSSRSMLCSGWCR